MTNCEIAGKKVYLRFLTRDDTSLIVKWRNTERVRKNFIYQELFTEEGHLRWFDTMLETGKAVQFLIVEKQTDRPIGSVYFRDISKEHKKAEYGIFIGEEDAAGKGYGTETAKLAIQYGFNQMKLHKIILRALAENQQAIKSYENAGFEKEAYLRDEVCIQGEYRDIVLMGIINQQEGIYN